MSPDQEKIYLSLSIRLFLDFELDTVIELLGLFLWRGYAYILQMGRKINLISNDQKGRLLSLVSSAHVSHFGTLSGPLVVKWVYVTSSGKKTYEHQCY